MVQDIVQILVQIGPPERNRVGNKEFCLSRCQMDQDHFTSFTTGGVHVPWRAQLTGTASGNFHMSFKISSDSDSAPVRSVN